MGNKPSRSRPFKLTNETSSEVIQNLLKKYYDHPCKACGSTRISHDFNQLWVCKNCQNCWGYDDSTNFSDLKIRPYPNACCKNDDINKIKLIVMDYQLQFVYAKCGMEYEPKILNSISQLDRWQGNADQVLNMQWEAGQSDAYNDDTGNFNADQRRQVDCSNQQKDIECSSLQYGEVGHHRSNKSEIKKSRKAVTRTSWKLDRDIQKQLDKMREAAISVAVRLLSGGVVIMKVAIDSNTSPKKALIAFGIREVKYLIIQVCLALGTVAVHRLLMMAEQRGGRLGELGGLVRSILRQAVDDRLISSNECEWGRDSPMVSALEE